MFPPKIYDQPKAGSIIFCSMEMLIMLNSEKIYVTFSATDCPRII